MYSPFSCRLHDFVLSSIMFAMFVSTDEIYCEIAIVICKCLGFENQNSVVWELIRSMFWVVFANLFPSNTKLSKVECFFIFV